MKRIYKSIRESEQFNTKKCSGLEWAVFKSGNLTNQ